MAPASVALNKQAVAKCYHLSTTYLLALAARRICAQHLCSDFPEGVAAEMGRLKTAVRKATPWNRAFCKSFSQCFKLCRSRVRSPVGAGRQPSARVRESGCLLTPGYIACESEVPIDLGPAFCITMELVCSLSRDRIIASAIAAAREAELVETFVTNRSY
jgi:hypothetical protein